MISSSQLSHPTLKTIAELAGVSRMTVSRALRNDPLLSSGAVHRIQEIAERLGYRPDPRVSELMSHLRRQRSTRKSEVIAHVRVVDGLGNRADGGFSASRLATGAAAAANQFGYGFSELLWRVDQCNGRRMAEILHARGIRGAILCNEVQGFSFAGFCDRLACTLIGSPPSPCCLHRAGSNHEFTLGIGMEKLCQSGYDRVGLFLGSAAGSHTGYNWRGAFLTHQFERGDLEPELACVIERPDFTHFQRWIESVRPDSVMSNRQEVLGWLQAIGADVPGRVGFVQLDWSADCGPCAGIDQRLEEVGAVAVDLVHRQLMNNKLGPPEYPVMTLTNGAWVDGDSVRTAARTVSLAPVELARVG